MNKSASFPTDIAIPLPNMGVPLTSDGNVDRALLIQMSAAGVHWASMKKEAAEAEAQYAGIWHTYYRRVAEQAKRLPYPPPSPPPLPRACIGDHVEPRFGRGSYTRDVPSTPDRSCSQPDPSHTATPCRGQSSLRDETTPKVTPRPKRTLLNSSDNRKRIELGIFSQEDESKRSIETESNISSQGDTQNNTSTDTLPSNDTDSVSLLSTSATKRPRDTCDEHPQNEEEITDNPSACSEATDTTKNSRRPSHEGQDQREQNTSSSTTTDFNWHAAVEAQHTETDNC